MSPDRHPNLGEVFVADQVVASGPSKHRTRTIILLLAASVGLMMTGFGIIYPVFARRLGEFGGGVGALGLMTMSFALAQMLAAPFLGSLADRRGRRPVVLLALAAFAGANIGFLFAPSIEAFVVVRAVEGALTAGLFPAAMGVVADIVPENQRARWIGIGMASYGAGFFIGPVVGGLLYDEWGFAAPFLVSAAVAVVAFITAAILVPETRTPEVRVRELFQQRRAAGSLPAHKVSLWASLPRPLYVFGTMLIIDFVIFFAFAFVEPQMVFYLYDELDWTTTQFGIVVAAYGLATVIAQGGLGQLSDRFGRRPIIVLGLLLNVVFYAGLAVVTSFPLMLLIAAVSGVGEALIMPALSAFYLDITAKQHQSRIMGIKESAAALGGVAGPTLVVIASAYATPQGIFAIATVVMLATTGLAALALRRPRRVVEEAEYATQEYAVRRTMAANATLRGLVKRARAARKMHFAA